MAIIISWFFVNTTCSLINATLICYYLILTLSTLISKLKSYSWARSLTSTPRENAPWTISNVQRGFSVTRFGKISPFWQNPQSLGQFLRVFLLFGKFWTDFGKKFYAIEQIWYIIGPIFIVTNGQMLKNNLAVWSHWFLRFKFV